MHTQTAGFEVFSDTRAVSIMGVVLTALVVVVLGGAWGALKFADPRHRSERIVEGKIIDRYIETGEVRAFSLSPEV